MTIKLTEEENIQLLQAMFLELFYDIRYYPAETWSVFKENAYFKDSILASQFYIDALILSDNNLSPLLESVLNNMQSTSFQHAFLKSFFPDRRFKTMVIEVYDMPHIDVKVYKITDRTTLGDIVTKALHMYNKPQHLNYMRGGIEIHTLGNVLTLQFTFA